MQTRFTEKQRQDPVLGPRIKVAEPVLNTCVHYGFCTATCPTYVLTRDENDSPRGRIDLIREMLESDAPPKAATVHHLDRCLSCLGCRTTCAVSVDYMHLIDTAREHIEDNFRRPLADRLLRAAVAAVVPYPRRMRVALWLAGLAAPLRPLMPKALRGMMDLAPRDIDPAPTPAAIHPAVGTRRARVALMPGCAQQALDGAINAATLRLLTRAGAEVIIPQNLGCCGALTLHMGRGAQGRETARAAIMALMGAGDLDAVVINASGCGTQVKDYGHLFADTDLAGPAAHVAALARDVTEVIAELGLPQIPEPRRYRIAYHDACSMRHGQRLTRQPRALLRAAGYEVVDVAEGHMCCGSAGTYNMLQPEMAGQLGRRKAAHVAATAPDAAAMGNIGCLVQLRHHGSVPAVHTVELLDWATGGPRPRRLADLGPPAAPPEEAAAEAPPVLIDGTDAAPGGAFW